jgi:hypothetical protein
MPNDSTVVGFGDAHGQFAGEPLVTPGMAAPDPKLEDDEEISGFQRHIVGI